MRNGLSAGPLPAGLDLPGSGIIGSACLVKPGFSPFVLYGIKINETGYSIDGSILQEGANPATGLLLDGSNAGHGWFQLTDKWPENWSDPYANALYAIQYYAYPAEVFGAERGLQGDALVKFIGSAYNAGPETAWEWHVDHGDSDYKTTSRYGERLLHNYLTLLGGKAP